MNCACSRYDITPDSDCPIQPHVVRIYCPDDKSYHQEKKCWVGEDENRKKVKVLLGMKED